VSERQEKVEDVELFLVNLANGAATNPPAESAPIRLTRNAAVEIGMEWAPDNRHLFFQVNLGSAEGKYEDPQPRLYWVDAVDVSNSKLETDASDKRQAQRWFADYPGEVVSYTSLPDGSVLCGCRNGTEVEFVSQANPKAAIVKREGWHGAYERPDAAQEQSPGQNKARASPSPTRQRSGPPRFTWPTESTNWRKRVPSPHSTSSSPSAIFPKPSPIAGPPTTARPSKAG